MWSLQLKAISKNRRALQHSLFGDTRLVYALGPCIDCSCIPRNTSAVDGQEQVFIIFLMNGVVNGNAC